MATTTVSQFVTQQIKDNKVMVFSKSYCPFCSKAKKALYSLLDAAKVTILEIENRDDMDDIQDTLKGMTGGRSVPRVFISGEFIGGGDETATMASNGQLKKLLTDKGIL